jgi:hypothetical protein
MGGRCEALLGENEKTAVFFGEERKGYTLLPTANLVAIATIFAVGREIFKKVGRKYYHIVMIK